MCICMVCLAALAVKLEDAMQGLFTKIGYSEPTPYGEFIELELFGQYRVLVSRDQFRDYADVLRAAKAQTPCVVPDPDSSDLLNDPVFAEVCRRWADFASRHLEERDGRN